MNLLPNPFTESLPSTGGPEEAPAAACQNPVAAGLFVLDERSFMEAIEPAPLFLSAPRPRYLEIVELLAGY
jgi:hypothetical protein